MSRVRPPRCEVHDTPGVLVGGSVVYPHRPDLYPKWFWICRTTGCDARCGCHPNSKRPLGGMATKATRDARMRAHAAFDRLWKGGPGKRFETRSEAYRWLAAAMGLAEVVTHIGMFDAVQCDEVVRLVELSERDFAHVGGA